mmetsp:Transcript_9012/g.30557  ORF Transcript_9012/g.30557 Transcript_9012/m.30557 type:complete len:207 (+) Transcript_9012:1118-1738(+)
MWRGPGSSSPTPSPGWNSGPTWTSTCPSPSPRSSSSSPTRTCSSAVSAARWGGLSIIACLRTRARGRSRPSRPWTDTACAATSGRTAPRRTSCAATVTSASASAVGARTHSCGSSGRYPARGATPSSPGRTHDPGVGCSGSQLVLARGCLVWVGASGQCGGGSFSMTIWDTFGTVRCGAREAELPATVWSGVDWIILQDEGLLAAA